MSSHDAEHTLRHAQQWSSASQLNNGVEQEQQDAHTIPTPSHSSASYASTMKGSVAPLDTADGPLEHERNVLGGEVGLKGLFVTPVVNCFTMPLQYLQPWIATIIFVAIIIALAVTRAAVQWYWLPAYAYFLLLLAPYTKDPTSFFAASLTSDSRRGYTYVFLTASSFTAWLFAKSVYNSATLGYSYGLIGGLSYACYYFGIWSTGFVVYKLRGLGWSSFMEPIYARYGYFSCILFLLTLLYRLNNEIWSNLIVVGTFYSSTTDSTWWWACTIAALIPAFYVCWGGLKSSIITDLFQGSFVIVYLIIVLALIVPGAPAPFNSGLNWHLNGGLDQLCVALLQGVLSYPFMDPAMTDRAFLGHRKAMLAAFFTGGFMAMVFITLFSFIGIYGKQIGLANGSPALVTAHIGQGAFGLCSLIGISDSIATNDNTFSALAKLVGVEGYSLFTEFRPRTVFTAKKANMYIGRIAILIFVVAGILPLLGNQTALSATTASGTTVMGLGPSIWYLLFQPGKGVEAKRHPWAFLLPLLFSIMISSIYQGNGSEAGTVLLPWAVGDGKVKILFGVNLYGALISWCLFPIGWFLPWPAALDRWQLELAERAAFNNAASVKEIKIDAEAKSPKSVAQFDKVLKLTDGKDENPDAVVDKTETGVESPASPSAYQYNAPNFPSPK